MRARWLAKLLAPRLKAWAGGRPPDFRVVTQGEDYLRRWHVVKPRWWRPGLYLHQMLRDDDAVLHDHPYASVSLCLGEGLRERYVKDPKSMHDLIAQFGYGWGGVSDLRGEIRYPQPGDIIFRSSRLAHQLKVLPGSDPWTLFFTGPRLPKEWGFWCRRGWVHFKEYANVGNGKSGIGSGCGEE